MSNLPRYSTIFACLHDEPNPVGHLGRGAHYSICRSVEWLDVTLRPLTKARRHDFALIWDEDHDTRVVERIEALLLDGLLSPVNFIGERKGGLTIVLAERFYREMSHGVEEYLNKVQDSVNSIEDDYWSVNADRIAAPENIISDGQSQVSTYLRNIDNLWELKTLTR